MGTEGEDNGADMYRRYLSGDSDAFAELVALYEDEFSRFIHSIVGDSQEVRHIVVDAFSMLAVGGSGFAGRSSVKTYLFTIGKNLARKTARLLRRDEGVALEAIGNVLVGDSADPCSILEREESKRDLLKAMSALKEDHCAVLSLLYFEDMSYAEAGQAMGKSISQVRGLAHRARTSLKKELELHGITGV